MSAVVTNVTTYLEVLFLTFFCTQLQYLPIEAFITIDIRSRHETTSTVPSFLCEFPLFMLLFDYQSNSMNYVKNMRTTTR